MMQLSMRSFSLIAFLSLIINFQSKIAQANENLFAEISQCGDALYASDGYSYVSSGNTFIIKSQSASESIQKVKLQSPIVDILSVEIAGRPSLFTLTPDALELRNQQTGELEKSFSVPNEFDSRSTSSFPVMSGMVSLGSTIYVAAGAAGVLVFDLNQQTFQGSLQLPQLNDDPLKISGYIDVTAKGDDLIFLVDSISGSADPRALGSNRGLVTYNVRSQKSHLYSYVIDPGFETIDTIGDKLLITSFLPAWTFSLNSLLENHRPSLIRRWVSLGNLSLQKSGKIFFDAKSGMVYSCLKSKIVSMKW